MFFEQPKTDSCSGGSSAVEDIKKKPEQEIPLHPTGHDSKYFNNDIEKREDSFDGSTISLDDILDNKKSRPRLRLRVLIAAFIVGLLLLITLSPVYQTWQARTMADIAHEVEEHKGQASGTTIQKRDNDVPARQPLHVFQIAPPVLAPRTKPKIFQRDQSDSGGAVDKMDGTKQISIVHPPWKCIETVTLMEHVFGYSYGRPYVGEYLPPPCSFNRVIMNMTVTSKGRQFDRLAIMYLGDYEVYRTSTAEPTNDGIYWTYTKDMTPFLSLWREPQKVIFDLGNLVNDIYNGSFNITLTATFYTSAEKSDPADLIIPISARRSAQNGASAWNIPDQPAINTVMFPRNVERAVFTISTSGNADEEFWYSNVFQSNRKTFPGSPLFGYSPFREIQLLIDGRFAGFIWPFPVVFTGGVVPGLWRPVVGIDTFDLREYEIDITPWLPMLCDGSPKGHTFAIKVVGVEDDGHGHGSLSDRVGSNWITTGKIFLWTDDSGFITGGETPTFMNNPIQIKMNSTAEHSPRGENASLAFGIRVSRQFQIESLVVTRSGPKPQKWFQTAMFSNIGVLSDGSNRQITIQETTGLDYSSNGYSRQFDFPFSANTTYANDAPSGNFSISASISRSLFMNIFGESVFPSALQVFGAIPNLDQIPGIGVLTHIPNALGPGKLNPFNILKDLPKLAKAGTLPISSALSNIPRPHRPGRAPSKPPTKPNATKKKPSYWPFPFHKKPPPPAQHPHPKAPLPSLEPPPVLPATSNIIEKFGPDFIANAPEDLRPVLSVLLAEFEATGWENSDTFQDVLKPLKPLLGLPNRIVIHPYKGYNIATTQNGSAVFFSSPSKKWSSGFGTTEQDFAFHGLRTLGIVSTWPPATGGKVAGDLDPGGYETYQRHVKAINSTLVFDKEFLSGRTIGNYSQTNFTSYVSPEDVSGLDYVATSVNAMLGRGPGKRKPNLVFRG
jgi:hypothetical protein